MKAKITKGLQVLAVIAGCLFISVMYVVYVPLAIVRALVDKESFIEFFDCVGDCIKKLVGWFKKGAK